MRDAAARIGAAAFAVVACVWGVATAAAEALPRRIACTNEVDFGARDMIARNAAIAATFVALATTAPATAAQLHCVATAALNLNPERPVLIAAGDAEGADDAGTTFEFWVDTDTGEWQGRDIGSRALFSAGGVLDVISDGTGYRADWVGIERHGGYERLGLTLGREPVRFLRIRRDGFAETGTCVPGSPFSEAAEATP